MVYGLVEHILQSCICAEFYARDEGSYGNIEGGIWRSVEEGTTTKNFHLH